MLKMLMKKGATARRVYRQEGLTGVIAVVQARARFTKAVLHAFVSGDLVELDGCYFRLNRQIVPARLKAEFVLDIYEKPERIAIQQFVHPINPVIEMGGGIGVISCITNKRLRNARQHLVVEANPLLIPSLEDSRQRNACQFEIVQAAIGYTGDQTTLFVQRRFVLSSLIRASGQAVQVSTMTLQKLLERADWKDTKITLICDIEGMEYDLIVKEIDTIRQHVATLVIEIHPEFLDAAALSRIRSELEKHYFQLIHQNGKLHVFKAA
ncbi:MAG: FkbM family methyltransferase [Anaerolineae bacterium]|nr:FkbM family methyltransferase [Anaerolineae bacterium]